MTRRGVPVAEIKPPMPASSWLGSMQGTIEIVGDIVNTPAEHNWGSLTDLTKR